MLWVPFLTQEHFIWNPVLCHSVDRCSQGWTKFHNLSGRLWHFTVFFLCVTNLDYFINIIIDPSEYITNVKRNFVSCQMVDPVCMSYTSCMTNIANIVIIVRLLLITVGITSHRPHAHLYTLFDMSPLIQSPLGVSVLLALCSEQILLTHLFSPFQDTVLLEEQKEFNSSER